jgi:AraC-like DNA-binding protein
MNHFFISLHLFTAIQGIVLIFAISKNRNKNKEAFSILMIFQIVLILTLIGRFLYVSGFLPLKISIIPDLIIYLYGPLFYLFLISFFKLRHIEKSDSVHFLLPFIYMIVCTYLLSSDFFNFQSNRIPNNVKKLFIYTESSAIISNIIYFIITNRKLKNLRLTLRNEISFHAIPKYFYVLFYSIGIIFAFWALGFISRVLSFKTIETFSYFNIWLSISIATFSLSYIAIFQMVSVSIPKTEIENTSREKLRELNEHLLSEIKKNKYYKQQRLTKNDLSKLINISSTDISKIVNEIHGKNFYDFINEYRIQEFIELANSHSHKNYNYSSIATEVGFGSKATFYNFFKRYYGTLPSEYLKQHLN